MLRDLTLEEVILLNKSKVERLEKEYNIQINIRAHSIGLGDKGYDYHIYNPKNGRSTSSDIDGEQLEYDVLRVVYFD